MTNDQRYYITTPIYYVNDYPHIGHAYTTVACDAAARYARISGRDTFYLTGTDEHGQKIEKTAEKNGETPIELADRVVKRFQNLWKVLNISNNDFIRTTEERHKKGATQLYETVFKNGDIYEGEYEGWYAVNDEAFLTETQVKELGDKVGKDPNIVKLKEKTYFFKLSAYQDRLLDYYKKHPEFVQPASKRNEVMRFVEQGLRDLSISRTSFKWGIPVPGNKDHVIYVWFDALSNYLTALGYGSDEALYKKWWPANVHVVGKDILRFHAIFWPAFLMAADLPLPKTVYAHGWWTAEGEKMSKSKGNFVDPFVMVEKYGTDAFRYFLMRALPFGQDGDFSQSSFLTLVNSDLANDLGNLASRSIAMLDKYFDGKLPAATISTDLHQTLENVTKQAMVNYREQMQTMQFSEALKQLWSILSAANRYIDDTKPWQLAKEESKKDELGTVLYNVIECLRIVAIGIFPVMPTLANQLRTKLGQKVIDDFATDDVMIETAWGGMKSGQSLERGEALFQRLEDKKIETA
jgi:methionyl-tRNA synthetase